MVDYKDHQDFLVCLDCLEEKETVGGCLDLQDPQDQEVCLAIWVYQV